MAEKSRSQSSRAFWSAQVSKASQVRQASQVSQAAQVSIYVSVHYMSPYMTYLRGAPCLGADQKARGLWERDWWVSGAELVSSSVVDY